MLLCFLSGCWRQNSKTVLPSPPPESCAYNSSSQIQAAIDDEMPKIDDLRTQAKSCSDPTGCYFMGGYGCSNVKQEYGAWLNYISAALQQSSSSTSAQPTDSDFSGLGKQYQDVANAAQDISAVVEACKNPPTPPTSGLPTPTGDPSHTTDGCGKDVDCQLAKVQAAECAADPKCSPQNFQPSPFLGAGIDIFVKFKGCSSDVRKQASDYLNSHYSW